jgi:hypothetical protein
MCRRVECPNCGQPTFAGCGAHVEQVLRGVAPADRCQCVVNAQKKPRAEKSSWLRDLLSPNLKAKT